MSVRSPDLVGRSADLAASEAALRAGFNAEGPALVLILGEPGLGKSRLVSALVEAHRLATLRDCVEADAVVVGRGTAVPDGGATPLLPWADALRMAVRAYGAEASARAAGPALARLATLLPDLDPASVPAEEGGAVDVLPWYLGRLAAQRPLLVVLEDLHLADIATLTTLTRVLDLAPSDLVVVATARASGGLPAGSMGETEHWPEAVVRLRRMATTLELAPLPPVEAGELVEVLAQRSGWALDRGSLAQIVGQGQGNPFFLEELVAARASGRGTVPSAGVLGMRLESLDPAALEVAQAAAVHGSGVPHGMLRELAGLDEATLLEGLRGLVGAGHLVEDPDSGGYRFRHVLVGEAVRDRMLPVERRRLHAACARSVEAQLPQVAPAWRRRLLGRLPHHWSEAGETQLALLAAVRAAEASAAVDPDVAAAQYTRALALHEQLHATGREDAREAFSLGPEVPGRAELLERLAEQQGAAGDGAAATATARAALDLLASPGAQPEDADPARRSRLLRLVAVHGEGLLTDDEVQAAFVAAVEAAEGLGPSAELAAALAALARHELVLDHNAEAVRLARRARTTAMAVGADPEEAMAAATLGASLCYLGAFEEGLAVLAYAVPALEAAHRYYDAARAVLTLAWAQFHGGDPATGRASASRAAEAARDGGGPRDLALRLAAADLEMSVAMGEWATCEVRLAELDLDGAEDPAATVSSVEGALLRSVRAELALRRGDQVVAEAAFGAVLDHWDRLGLRAHDGGSLARLAEIAAGRGDFGVAREYVDVGLEVAETTDTWVAVVGFARAGLAVEAAAARAGRLVDPAHQARLAALLDKAGQGVPSGSVAAAEHATARAELTRLTGREDPAAWGAAAAQWDALGFPWWQTAAALRQVEAAVARGGGRDQAAGQVTELKRSAERLSARGLADAADDLARRAGLRLVPQETGRSASSSPPQNLVPQQGVRGSGKVASESKGRGTNADPLATLSAREREVVVLLSAGASNRRIAEQLFISEKTASVHVSHILTKLGVSSRLEAAAVVHRVREAAAERGSAPASPPV